MSNFKRYDNEFKKSLVDLHFAGKSQAELCRSYGVSSSALAKWVKQFSNPTSSKNAEIRLTDNAVNKQIQELLKRNAQLEEENLILKKASAILMRAAMPSDIGA